MILRRAKVLAVSLAAVLTVNVSNVISTFTDSMALPEHRLKQVLGGQSGGGGPGCSYGIDIISCASGANCPNADPSSCATNCFDACTLNRSYDVLVENSVNLYKSESVPVNCGNVLNSSNCVLGDLLECECQGGYDTGFTCGDFGAVGQNDFCD